MILCGNCRAESIPKRVGTHRCDKCGQCHTLYMAGNIFVIDPNVRPKTVKEGELEYGSSR